MVEIGNAGWWPELYKDSLGNVYRGSMERVTFCLLICSDVDKTVTKVTTQLQFALIQNK